MLVSNLHRRYTGISATVRTVVAVQQRSRKVALLDIGGLGLPDRVGGWDLLREGWRPPAGFRHRVFHGRRALDLVLGVALTRVLRQPWKLVFTSASPRRHGWFWRGLIGRCDAIIATSEDTASYLDWPSTVVPHGVDTEDFRPPADKRAAWRESGLPGRYGIGLFGRIRPSKGSDLFVEAMCELLPRYPEWSAVITGFCKPGDREFREGLVRRIAESGLSERVVFTGDLEPDEIRRWYQRITLCVAPSRSEGFGLTPLEAMASGAAAVTSSTGYFPRMMVPGTNGAIVETDDLAALVGAIDGLISDPDALIELGERARRYCVERHSVEAEVAGIHSVYDSLLGED